MSLKTQSHPVSEEDTIDVLVDALERGHLWNHGRTTVEREVSVPQPGVVKTYRADVVFSDGHTRLAIECKGKGGNIRKAIGQALTYEHAGYDPAICVPITMCTKKIKILGDICVEKDIFLFVVSNDGVIDSISHHYGCKKDKYPSYPAP